MESYGHTPDRNGPLAPAHCAKHWLPYVMPLDAQTNEGTLAQPQGPLLARAGIFSAAYAATLDQSTLLAPSYTGPPCRGTPLLLSLASERSTRACVGLHPEHSSISRAKAIQLKWLSIASAPFLRQSYVDLSNTQLEQQIKDAFSGLQDAT